MCMNRNQFHKIVLLLHIIQDLLLFTEVPRKRAASTLNILQVDWPIKTSTNVERWNVAGPETNDFGLF